MAEAKPKIGILSESMYGQKAGTGYACASLVQGLRSHHNDFLDLVEIVRKPLQGSGGRLLLDTVSPDVACILVPLCRFQDRRDPLRSAA